MSTFARFDTTEGTFTIRLFDQEVPNTVANFVGLAEGTREWTDPRDSQKKTAPFYDGIIFHRIIQGFVCQGGDPEGSGRGGPGYRFRDEEVKKPYELGSVAMANAGPNTNGSQFFLISGPSGVGLPPQYNHFGKIVEGLDVLDRMEKVPTGPGDRPREDVVINSGNYLMVRDFTQVALWVAPNA